MTPVVAFTYKASKEDAERANKCMDMLGVPYNVYDIPSYRVEGHLHDGQVVFSFGKTIGLMVDEYIKSKGLNVRSIQLPHLKQLRPLKDNVATREQVKLLLEAETELLHSAAEAPMPAEISLEDLPDLSHMHILLLKKMIDEKGQKTCLQVSRNGKKVLIGNEPDKQIEHDLFITFEELYTIRQAMDVLGVEKVNVVRNS